LGVREISRPAAGSTSQAHAVAFSPAAPRTNDAYLIIKVGGSLVSDKRRDGDLDLSAVQRYAAMVADLARTRPGRIVLVAGGGSLGHAAVRHADETDSFALAGLTQATFTVKCAWAKALQDEGVRALPVQVAAVCRWDAEDAHLDSGIVDRLLASAIVPVLAGDCVLTASGELRVLGSDHVPALLLSRLPGDVRVVCLTDVPGVLIDGRGGGLTLPDIDPRHPEEAGAYLWDNAHDTSGAMKSKIDALARLARRGAECFILGGADRRDLRFLLAPCSQWDASTLYTRIALDPLLES
jgi:isopentenyl phosphate kinase